MQFDWRLGRLGWWGVALWIVIGVRSAGAAPVTIEGQRFDEAIQVAGAPLKLNGAGLRAVLWIKGFAAGLYVPRPSSDVQQLLDDPGNKRLSLRMLMDVPVDEIVKALRSGLRKNATPQELERMRERMDQIEAQLRAVGVQRKGDVLDLDWRADSGLVLLFNGKPQGPVLPGYDLYRGLLKIFIGERARDKRLRAGLLGGPASPPPGSPLAATPTPSVGASTTQR